MTPPDHIAKLACCRLPNLPTTAPLLSDPAHLTSMMSISGAPRPWPGSSPHCVRFTPLGSGQAEKRCGMGPWSPNSRPTASPPQLRAGGASRWQRGCSARGCGTVVQMPASAGWQHCSGCSMANSCRVQKKPLSLVVCVRPHAVGGGHVASCRGGQADGQAKCEAVRRWAVAARLLDLQVITGYEARFSCYDYARDLCPSLHCACKRAFAGARPGADAAHPPRPRLPMSQNAGLNRADQAKSFAWLGPVRLRQAAKRQCAGCRGKQNRQTGSHGAGGASNVAFLCARGLRQHGNAQAWAASPEACDAGVTRQLHASLHVAASEAARTSSRRVP